MRRVTKETQVEVELNLDGAGAAETATGVPFFDHMLPHHVVEAQFKAFARALRAAAAPDPRGTGIPSTKGVL